MLSNLMMQLGNHVSMKLEEDMVRHMVLNSLRSYNVKYSNEFGEMVIAADNTNYWRRKFFPYYKASRKENQKKSDLDWNAIFETLNKIRQELKDYFPYRVIDIESAEADDVIGTLAKEFHNDQPILILSGDKDFIQLQAYPNVKQYDPVRKKWIAHEDPKQYLKEHILRGDSGDGIPNVLSNDNCFVIKERQKRLTSQKMQTYLDSDKDKLPENIARNYHRNATLIDLSNTPKEIQDKVLISYHEQSGKKKTKLLDFFIEKRLKNLIEYIGDF